MRLTLCIVFPCPCYFVCLFIYFFSVSGPPGHVHIHISPSQHRSLATTGCSGFKDSSRSLSNVPGQHTVLLYTHTHCFAVSTLSHLLSHYIRTHTSPLAPPLPIRPPCPFVPFIWRLYQFAFHAICEGISGSLVADLRYYEGHPVRIAIQCRVT